MVDFEEDDWNFAQMEFSTFEGTFEVIKSKKCYRVYPVKIHENYGEYVALQLTNKLNENGVKTGIGTIRKIFKNN